MDPLAEREPAPAARSAAPTLPVPGSVALAGARGRRARAAFTAALVALALLASLAAWQGFLHSPWAQRLGALNELVFVGGVESPANFSGPQLYAMRPDGSGLRRLTPGGDTAYFSPVWSPDGASIAAFVTSAHDATTAHLVIMNADGSHAQVLSAVALNLDVFNEGSGADVSEVSKLIAWSPDSRQLVALVGVGRYMLVQADGSRPRLVNAIRPTWSPDGRYLAFYANAPQTQEDDSGANGESYQIQLLDVQSLQTRVLSNLASLNAEVLAWSPDGRYLAASAFQEGSFRSRPIDSMMLVYPNTGQISPVASWLDTQVQEVAWSPDSQRLAVVVQRFSSTDAGGQDSNGFYLFVANLAGSRVVQVGLTDDGQPSWSPDGKQLVYDDAAIPELLVADTTTQPKAAIRRLAAPALSYLFGPCWSPLARLL